jgi:hypothetical protein
MSGGKELPRAMDLGRQDLGEPPGQTALVDTILLIFISTGKVLFV